MQLFPFIGRASELEGLAELTHKKSSSLIVIRGRRRIGKSRLVEEFAKNHRFLRFAGLPPTDKTTAHSQREIFAKQLSTQLNAPPVMPQDWSDLFSALARETKTGRVIILFDEISWMGFKDEDFLGKLKEAWDILFKKNPELMLILCGSVSSWIEDNILRNTGFMGRLSWVLELKELSVKECNQLLIQIGFKGPAYEKFKLLSVTGGIPRYLEEIRPHYSADENIKALCFVKQGVLFREFQDIFLDIFARRSETYRKIIETLVDGDKEFSDIAVNAELTKTGHLSDYLNDLTQSGFISRDYTWNVKDGKMSRLSRYRLSDNYMRFYLKYIEKNKSKINANHFESQPLSSLSGFYSIMGLQFENLVLNNRSFIWKKLQLHPGDIITDNPYFQKTQLRKKGCQIDYLIQTKACVLYACEVKFSREAIKSEVIEQMQQKIARVYLPRRFSIVPVLIHVNGVTDSVRDADYFHHIIDFSELLGG